MRRALAFLTALGGSAAPTPTTMTWFPVAGLLIGMLVGAGWWLAAELWPPLLAAALVVALDLAITGLLHADGLLDTADGLLPQVPRERRLEIMAEPAIGAYGVVAGVVVYTVRIGAFAAVAPDVLLVAAVWCLSRTAMAVAARSLPYARDGGGLASAMIGADWRPVLVLGAVMSGAAALIADGLAGLAALAVGAAAAAGLLWSARRRLGGFTGDVLGAVGVVAETSALVAVAASW